MRVHVLTSTSSVSNLNVEGVYVDRDEAIAAWRDGANKMAQLMKDHTPMDWTTQTDECWSYMPDDTGEYDNMAITLTFDVPLSGELERVSVAHIGEDYGLLTVDGNDKMQYEVPRGLAVALSK